MSFMIVKTKINLIQIRQSQRKMWLIYCEHSEIEVKGNIYEFQFQFNLWYLKKEI